MRSTGHRPRLWLTGRLRCRRPVLPGYQRGVEVFVVAALLLGLCSFSPQLDGRDCESNVRVVGERKHVWGVGILEPRLGEPILSWRRPKSGVACWSAPFQVFHRFALPRGTAKRSLHGNTCLRAA